MVTYVADSEESTVTTGKNLVPELFFNQSYFLVSATLSNDMCSNKSPTAKDSKEMLHAMRQHLTIVG